MKDNIFSIVLHTGFWALYVLLFTMLISNFIPFGAAFSRVFMSGLVLAFAFYFNALFLVNTYLEKKKWLLFFSWVVALTLATGVLRFVILNSFNSSEINFAFPDKPKSLLIASVATQLIIIVISTLYQVILNRVTRDRLKQEMINIKNEAEIKFLKAQINPHFLFNTLNNIYALSVTGSEKTSEMILKLSDLLRYVIYGGREKKVPLSHEIKHIQKFIDLFQMRSETLLNIHLESKGNCGNLLIEPMILIPLVENCFKHTDFDTNTDAYAKITVELYNDSIHFITINTKNQGDSQKDKTGGVGLENIKKRLEMNYKSRFELMIQNEEKIFEVNLNMQLDHA